MKCYRGFNNNYPNLGVKPDQKGIWMTEDYDYAKQYANMFKNGAIAEIEVDDRYIILASENECFEIFGDEFDELGGDVQWDNEVCDVLKEKGYDGFVFDDYGVYCYYIFNRNLIKGYKIIKTFKNDREDAMEGYDKEINDVLKHAGVQLDEREDLTKFNRIAGFYHYDTKQFELFPRTTEEISTEDDEINDYIHRISSKKELLERHVVRFGIEDIPGEGVICYIEGDTKRNAEECYYAIMDEYQEQCDIIKYEIEYYVGSSKKMIEFDAYGNQIMESVNRLDEKVIPVNKDLTDTKLVTSAYELNEIIKNNNESRVVYDKKNNWFLIDNSEVSIHTNLLNDALKDGIYPSFEWNGHIIDGSSENDGDVLYELHSNDFILFRTTSDQLNGEDYYYDRYQYCYIYKDYYVFDRKLDFQETPLYKLLGEPIDIENIGNVDEELNESVNKGIDFIAYHGGVEPDMIPAKDRPLYLTDSFELAHKFAKREIWNDGLYAGEIPTVFTFKGHFNNPYYMTLDEYNDEGQDSNIDIQKWIEMGVDGIVLPPNEEGSTTYYIVIDTSTIKLIDKKVYTDEGVAEELDESVDYDIIREKVFNYVMSTGEIIDNYIITDYDYDVFMNSYVPEELVNKLIEESGLTDTYQQIDYIKENYGIGVSKEIIKFIFDRLYANRKEFLEQELSMGNKVYRMIATNEPLEEVIEHCKTNGIGNCWAKDKGNAFSYFADGGQYEYIFEAEVDEKDVDWERTMLLRMSAENEDEIRLLKNAKIKVLSVSDGNSNKTIPLNIIMPVGDLHSY